MHTFKRSTCLAAVSLACLLGAGCVTQVPQVPTVSVVDLFDDRGMAPPSHQITTAHLFELSPAMKAYINSQKFQREVDARGPELGLFDALYRADSLQLVYDASITRDAAETYAARRGNCLSLVIMTAAFAKALNLEVRFQDVKMGTDWSRTGDMYVGSNHVNISLAAPPSVNLGPFATPTRITIDFVPEAQAAQHRSRKISENMIAAMYLNNRAAEAMEANQLDDAYWYAKAAVQQEPQLKTAYNTLGVLYQKRSNSLMAERSFKRALALDPDDAMVMNNLVPVLAALGKNEESTMLAARAKAADPAPPFFFYESGMRAMAAGDYAEARTQFAREVQRAPDNHEFHYWLGSAHLRLGENSQARSELALALEKSNSDDASKRYSTKLDRLRAQR